MSNLTWDFSNITTSAKTTIEACYTTISSTELKILLPIIVVFTYLSYHYFARVNYDGMTNKQKFYIKFLRIGSLISFISSGLILFYQYFYL